jgi:serine/threonine protein kinase
MTHHRSEPSAASPGRSPDDTDALDPSLMATRVEPSRGPGSMGAPSKDGVRSGPAASSASGESRSASKADSKGGSKGGTSFDTMVGQLAIERGLATPEEVKHCQAQVVTGDGPAGQSLAQLLIQHDYVTERQLTRLRQIIEEERSDQQIPGFKIEGKLGAGAMANGVQGQAGQPRPARRDQGAAQEVQQNPQFIERFYATRGRAAAQLNHPNIVQAFDVGRAGDLYYFVMEYVEGRTVHDDIVSAEAVRRGRRDRHRDSGRRGARARPRAGS